MYLKLIYTSLLITLFSFSTAFGQTGNTATSQEGSIIDISTAELQTLMEELMQFKQKRMQQYAYMQQQNLEKEVVVEIETREIVDSNNKNTTTQRQSTIEDAALNRRISEMEKLLLDMKEQLRRMEAKEVTTIAAAPMAAVQQKDLDSLQSELKTEMSTLNKMIRELSNTAPTMRMVQNGKDTVTIVQNNNQEYLKEYATQMLQLRRDVNGVETQLLGMPSKLDYTNLQKQLDRIEQKSIAPIVIQTEDKDNGVTERIIADAMGTGALTAQIADLRDMVQEMKTASEQKAVVEKSVTVVPQVTTGGNNNDTIVAQFNAQFEELRNMIANIQPDTIIQIQPEIRTETQTIKETVVTVPAPVIETTKAPETKAYDPLESILSRNKTQRLFYGNNAYKTTGAHEAAMEKTIGLMTEYPSLSLSIVGYASPSGSPSYNQQLSQKRAETAKKHLIKNGIDSNRISTEFYGIDESAVDAAQGRRVELVLMRGR